jgi:acetolactate synthase-like protein
MSRGLLGKNNQLQMRHQRKEALKEADLVILAGTVCDFRLSYGRVLPRGVPVIAVNRDKDQLYRVMTLLNSFNSTLLNNDAQAYL